MSLNDPRWGRGDSDESEEKKNAPDSQDRGADRGDDRGSEKNTSPKKNEGDDLDRLWDEFNRALGGMLGQAEAALTIAISKALMSKSRKSLVVNPMARALRISLKNSLNLSARCSRRAL